MVLEGKFSGQTPRFRFNSGNPMPLCGCCESLIDRPKSLEMTILGRDGIERKTITYNYIGTKHFIYESKSGFAVAYCNKECRDKHNHRFNPRK